MDLLHTSVKLLLFAAICNGKTWDFSHVDVQNYSLLDVSVSNNRAFVSIKPIENLKNVTYPTLVEVPWPNSVVYPRIFPSKEHFLKGNCNKFQSIVSTDLDSLGRIWILDEGDEEFKCSGKLIVYNLFTNHIAHKFIFKRSKFKLSKVVVDTSPLQLSQRAYVGVKNRNILFVCHTLTNKCSLMHLKSTGGQYIKSSLIYTESIALSKYDKTLYVTSSYGFGLYKINLEPLQNRIFQESDATLNAQYVGDKLGRSRGLLIHPRHGLCYYLIRDYAIVCWNMISPMRAESYTVLEQSYDKLPNVVQLILDTPGNIWAVVNPEINKSILTLGLRYKIGQSAKNSQPKCVKITY